MTCQPRLQRPEVQPGSVYIRPCGARCNVPYEPPPIGHSTEHIPALSLVAGRREIRNAVFPRHNGGVRSGANSDGTQSYISSAVAALSMSISILSFMVAPVVCSEALQAGHRALPSDPEASAPRFRQLAM